MTVKKLGFGLMRLPLLNSDDQSSVDIETVKKMADLFLANGFTYFDTAAPYHNGMSETAFRRAVAERYDRTAYTITDKLSVFMVQSEDQLPGFFEAQLKRLGVEYMDYYWLHTLGGTFYRKAEELHAFDFIRRLKEQGRVKHIGFSFHDKPELLDEILTRHPEMEYVQIQLNYLDWDDAAIESRRCCETAARHEKPVIVMEPVKGGSLVNIPDEARALFNSCRPGFSAASWAIRFAASQKNVVMVLSGMSNEAQMSDNISYMRDFQPMNAEELKIVNQAAGIIRSSIAIPCTGCRYCTEGCPRRIAIPDYFAIYNALKSKRQELIAAQLYYSNISQLHGTAGSCIGCGQCERRCPQHLPVRKYLSEVAAVLEQPNDLPV